MAAGTFTLYDSFAKNIGNGFLDLASDALKYSLLVVCRLP